MNAYYETTYRSDYKGQAAPPLRKIVRGFLGAADRRRMLRPLLEAPHEGASPRMLDVGCGAGELVYLMRRDGVDASGLEPGIEFAEFARTVLRVPVQTAAVDAATVCRGVAGSGHDVSRAGACSRSACGADDGPRLVEARRPAGRRSAKHRRARSGAVTPVPLRAPASLHRQHPRRAGRGGRPPTRRHQVHRATVATSLCVFERGDDELSGLPSGWKAEAARTLAALSSHTAVGHYLSPVPFARALGRLRRRLRRKPPASPHPNGRGCSCAGPIRCRRPTSRSASTETIRFADRR